MGGRLVGKIAVVERGVSVIVVIAARNVIKLQEVPTSLRSRVRERDHCAPRHSLAGGVGALQEAKRHKHGTDLQINRI